MNECLQLKKSNCKNCYKCIRHCPVKSIAFSENQADILPDDCILCGRCFAICPQNAKQIRDDVPKAKELLALGSPVVASVAPSFIANFGVKDLGVLEKALTALGFSGAEETAVGATLVKKQYEQMIARREKPVIISSCCPSVNKLIQRYYPEALEYLADVLTPAEAHCREIKSRLPASRTVFIGPCISKKYEADHSQGLIDCALTFEELSGWLEAEGIRLEEEEKIGGGGRANSFPITGGIIRSMYTENTGYDYVAVDGVENCMDAIREIMEGRLTHCFVEMSACTGGCIGGPAMHPQRKEQLIGGRLRVQAYSREEDLPVAERSREELRESRAFLGDRLSVMPGEAEIRRVLAQIGKTRPEDELNCGSCGYNTCREKAIAVCLGKADLNMCLPYLKERAESFSDTIIGNTPNAIMVLDEELNVQQINAAACRLFRLRTARDVLGSPAVRLLDPSDYIGVIQSRKNIYDKRHYIAEYERYVEETVIYDKDYHIVITFMKDITEQEREQEKLDESRRQAVEITDRVIEKQMRVVQEIASLLGETTAETQVALTKLKGTLSE